MKEQRRYGKDTSNLFSEEKQEVLGGIVGLPS
jgi:hypothetical protein